MMEGREYMEKKKEAIIQNLKDAGCDSDTITCFMNYFEAKELKKEQQVLSKHRRTLLDDKKKKKKQIDCLDYLSWQIEKKY